MAAAAVVLFGMYSCGQKAEANNEAEAATAPQESVQEVAVVEETVIPDSLLSQFTTTPSGLKYRVIKKGEGKQPGATDLVTVNYEGKLLDGTVFDSSYQRGEPATFPLNRVIAGWTEGVQLMPVGSIYEFYIPYNLAYGEMGNPPVIPPKSDLIFTVELLEVQ